MTLRPLLWTYETQPKAGISLRPPDAPGVPYSSGLCRAESQSALMAGLLYSSPLSLSYEYMVRLTDQALTGTIPMRGVIGKAVFDLGCRIASGVWSEGETISREADMVSELDASRSVVREAVRILSAKGMLRSRTSDGTRVRPRSEWRLLDPDVMQWRIAGGDTEGLLGDLLALRLVLEPGVAHQATLAAGEAHRNAVAAAWAEKVRVIEETGGNPAERRDAFISSDLAFHRALIAAVGSPLLDQLFTVIEAALELLIDLQMRAKGYQDGVIGMDESHEMHQAVFDAFIARDADGASEAMRRLVVRAIEDADAGFALMAGRS